MRKMTKKQLHKMIASSTLRYFVAPPMNHRGAVPLDFRHLPEITFDEVERRVRELRDKEGADKILEISRRTNGVIYLHPLPVPEGRDMVDYEAIICRFVEN